MWLNIFMLFMNIVYYYSLILKTFFQMDSVDKRLTRVTILYSTPNSILATNALEYGG